MATPKRREVFGMIFFEHETKYMGKRINNHIIRFNGKWLTRQDGEYIYTENPFDAIQMIKFVK